MPDTTPIFSGRIQWPEDIDEQLFLDQYWQKKPLLIRQAFPDFETPLPADELAGLSLEPDTSGRIITQDDDGAYHLEHGPFDAERFATLDDNRWSLLVTDVEKHLPEFAAFLQPFRFIPDWRIDDLMISYAPDGASVGAHVDEYDVFLLQGSGVRTWSIDADNATAHVMRNDGDLKILANFRASDTWDLVAGDMLYLPPGMAHHGIAVGENCTTWSIGFRAPLIPDLVARLADLLSEKMQRLRYTDDTLSPAEHGEITHASIQRFKNIWCDATQLPDAEFAELLGCFLSESSSASPDSVIESTSGVTHSEHEAMTFLKAPFSRFAWTDAGEGLVRLFADGSSMRCTRAFAQHICTCVQYVDIDKKQLDSLDAKALDSLTSMGCLHQQG